MIVKADRTKNQVIIRGDRGTKIILSWAAAANLSTLLSEKSHEAEPAPAKGKSYSPTSGRWG